MIAEGEGDFGYAYYALTQFNILPSAYARMSLAEKAVLCGMIDYTLEIQKKAQKRSRKPSGNRRLRSF